MKTMCPPGYHHNGFVATHALGKKSKVEGYKQLLNSSLCFLPTSMHHSNTNVLICHSILNS